MNKYFLIDVSGWVFKFTSSKISSITPGAQTRLRIGDFEVDIESPFRLTHGGETFDLVPANVDSLSPLLNIVPGRVVSGRVNLDGTLVLELSDASRLVVPFDPNFEAWQVRGPDGFLVVCLPGGGEPAVWNPEVSIGNQTSEK